MEPESRRQIHGALDLAQHGAYVATDLALETTLEITDIIYGTIRLFGVWPVVLGPIYVMQRSATVAVFRCVRLGIRAVASIAALGIRVAR